jgi:hypothetical protein
VFWDGNKNQRTLKLIIFIFIYLLNYTYAQTLIGCLERSLMYARHSLYNECEAQSRNGGLVHLTVASVYLELGGFRRCLEVKIVMITLNVLCAPIHLTFILELFKGVN